MSVSLTDQDNQGLLQNFCYDQCSINDDTQLKMSRGLIYKENKPFVKSFGFTPEFTPDNIDNDTKQYITSNLDTSLFILS